MQIALFEPVKAEWFKQFLFFTHDFFRNKLADAKSAQFMRVSYSMEKLFDRKQTRSTAINAF